MQKSAPAAAPSPDFSRPFLTLDRLYNLPGPATPRTCACACGISAVRMRIDSASHHRIAHTGHLPPPTSHLLPGTWHLAPGTLTYSSHAPGQSCLEGPRKYLREPDPRRRHILGLNPVSFPRNDAVASETAPCPPANPSSISNLGKATATEHAPSFARFRPFFLHGQPFSSRHIPSTSSSPTTFFVSRFSISPAILQSRLDSNARQQR